MDAGTDRTPRKGGHVDGGESRPGQRLYRFLFRFLGPAQLGSEAEPETKAADPAFACPVCGHPMAEHMYTQTADRKRLQCPGPPLRPRG